MNLGEKIGSLPILEVNTESWSTNFKVTKEREIRDIVIFTKYSICFSTILNFT